MIILNRDQIGSALTKILRDARHPMKAKDLRNVFCRESGQWSVTKREINSILHNDLHGFLHQDESFCWTIKPMAIQVKAPPTQIELTTTSKIVNKTIGNHDQTDWKVRVIGAVALGLLGYFVLRTIQNPASNSGSGSHFQSKILTPAAETYVKPFHRSNGVVVQGHHRTTPDNITSNNWSTKGNVNPYTGKRGIK